MKNIYKAASLSVTSLFILAQFGCSTPTTSTPSNTPATSGTNTTTTDTTVAVQAKSFLLTQKDASGVTNPIVPEDIESITVNGKALTATDIAIIKGGLKIQAAGDVKISFKDGKFVLEGDTATISIKLKGVSSPFNLPLGLLNLASSSDLRMEVTKNAAGDITGFIGGLNNNGTVDTTKTVFSFDAASKSIIVLQPSGEKSTFAVDNISTEVKPGTKSVDTKLSGDDAKKEIEKTTMDIKKPSAAAGFVGKWKYNALGSKLSLTLREAGSSNIGYSSTFSNEAAKFNSSFSGSVAYTSDNATTLNIDSTIAGKAVKGKVMLQGDNQLVFTITQTDVAEVKSFMNLPLTLERDTM